MDNVQKITTLEQFLESSRQEEDSVAYMIRFHFAAPLRDNPPDGLTMPEGVSGHDLIDLPYHNYGVFDRCTEEGRARYDQTLRELMWVCREQNRFDRKLYQQPSWSSQLPYARFSQLWSHFLHLSVEKQGERDFVAFTPNAEYGKRDRQVRMKVGSYLTKFYKDVLTPEQIRSIVNSCKPVKVIFGETEDDFVNAYEKVIDSCMGGHHDFDYDLHPSAVYAGSGDFQIACLVPQDEGATIAKDALARAVLFRDKDSGDWCFKRAYGPESLLLIEMLKEQGFKYQRGYLNGCRLRRIEVDDDVWLMPYVDGISCANVSSNGKYFELADDGDYCVQSTQGWVGEPRNRVQCYHCDTRIDIDADNYVVDSAGDYICEGCTDDGTYVHAIVGRRNSLYGDGTRVVREWTHRDNTVEIDGEYYYDSYDMLSEFDFVQLHDGEWAKLDETILLTNGERAREGDSDFFRVGRDRDTGEEVFAPVSDFDDDWSLGFVILNEGDNPTIVEITDPESDPVFGEGDIYYEDGKSHVVSRLSMQDFALTFMKGEEAPFELSQSNTRFTWARREIDGRLRELLKAECDRIKAERAAVQPEFAL